MASICVNQEREKHNSNFEIPKTFYSDAMELDVICTLKCVEITERGRSTEYELARFPGSAFSLGAC